MTESNNGYPFNKQEPNSLRELWETVRDLGRARSVFFKQGELEAMSEETLRNWLCALQPIQETQTVCAGPMPSPTPEELLEYANAQPMMMVYAGPGGAPGGSTGMRDAFMFQNGPLDGGDAGPMTMVYAGPGQMQGNADTQPAEEQIGACPQCGCAVRVKSNFCHECGSPLSWE